MKKCGVFPVFVVVLCGLASVNCDITLEGTKCGHKICKRDEHCSSYNRNCEPCKNICTIGDHNYDATECTKNCQDYIHDSLYVSKDGIGNDDENLKATVQRLSRMITVTLSLVCFMLVVLASVLCFQLYRWKKKKNITVNTIKSIFFSKKSNSNPPETKTTPASNQASNGKPDLRLEIPAESTHSGNSPVTVTTSISRRPAEDSTLDYAYDNPAMSSSPNNKTNHNAF